MFAAVSALIALVPFASALVLETPTGWQSSTPANISWLSNPDEFHNSYAIGNNIPASNDFFAFEMPTVAVGAGYYVLAINISNINQVFAQTGEFSIAAPPASVPRLRLLLVPPRPRDSASATSSGASSAASSTSPASGTFNGAARFDVSFGSLAVAAIGVVAGAVVAL
ncbi:uncharacterized protein B0H18DRAFT_996037 [Fomitopsis serialis]|uniref:uncharacterized protein n=1 Tax=Fomitopsis serialis TaxID=139415 RepID=UPI0020085EAC|nr:uncharacterized protein B0H18DRAFT_996037 [Neoantrodia serialis]KAH9929739.1 hypothetical protein B0H18DRAFT_996037 [Neoantrodia serialis]